MGVGEDVFRYFSGRRSLALRGSSVSYLQWGDMFFTRATRVYHVTYICRDQVRAANPSKFRRSSFLLRRLRNLMPRAHTHIHTRTLLALFVRDIRDIATGVSHGDLMISSFAP